MNEHTCDVSVELNDAGREIWTIQITETDSDQHLYRGRFVEENLSLVKYGLEMYFIGRGMNLFDAVGKSDQIMWQARHKEKKSDD